MIGDDTYRIASGQDETYRQYCDTCRMITPADRLKRARELRGYASPTEAATAYGWPVVTYRAHENGGRGLKPEVAARYAKALRVEPSWLLYGDGPEPEPGNIEPVEPNPHDQPNVIWEQGPVKLPNLLPGANDVEEKGVTVGGFGDDESAFELNGESIDYVRRPPGIVGRKHVFALRVSNTSMEPKFDDGERIYVEKRHPAIRDFVVVELHPLGDGRPSKSYIKRLVGIDARKITVEQYNPRGLLEFGRHEVKNLFRVIPEKELRGEA